MDPNTSTDRGAADDGSQADSQANGGVPSAAGKPSDGAANPADQGRSTTTSSDPNKGAELPSVMEQLIAQENGQQAEAKDDGDEDEGTQDDDDQKPREDAQGDDDQKPEPKPEDDQKPDDQAKKDEPKPGERGYARKRIKNLETELAKVKSDVEKAQAPILALEQRAQALGYTGPEEVLEAIDHYKSVKAELSKAQQTKPPMPDAVKALAKEIKELGYDVAPLEAAFASSDGKEATPAATKPATPPPGATSQPQQNTPSPAVIAATASMKTLCDDIRTQHGEKADDLIQRIGKELMRRDAELREETGHGLKPEAWEKTFRAARDRVLAQVGEESQRKPPKTLRSASSASKGSGKPSIMDGILGL